MRHPRLLILLAAALAGLGTTCSATDPGTTPRRDGGRGDAATDATMSAGRDTDGDTISDEDEPGDTDMDGTPDAEDTDSDGDGVLDADEAGDADARTPPQDSDRDGTPDARDTDSDGNGIPDAMETPGDIDGDGRAALVDQDDDGDGIQDVDEIGGNPSAPVDTDMDGTADFRDTDSDGDTIRDGHEQSLDTDRDGTPDARDTDSDGDGLSDAAEAGDMDLATPPVDTDMDGTADFRDADSDGDGLADSTERTRGTSPTRADSDGDGVSDLIEVAYGSNPNSGMDSPRTRGDFVFVVPYSAPPDPPIQPDPRRDTLSFSTRIQRLDVYVAIDTSGSMSGEISNLQTSFRTTIVPEVARRVPDAQFGVGRFEDCPSSTCRNAMNNLLDITGDVTRVQNTLNTGLGTLCGGSEPYRQMLWLIATGNTSMFSGNVSPRPRRCTDPRAVGWPCFRPDAVKVIVQAGDEAFAGGDFCSPRGDHAMTVAAMNAANIRYIGIESTGSSSSTVRRDMEQVARDTRSVTSGGMPLVFSIPSSGAGLGTALVDAITQLASAVPIRVDALLEDEPGDAVNAPMAFVDHVETNTSGAMAMGRVCTNVPAADGDGDGRNDHYPRVNPGTSVCFDIIAKPNTTVPATFEPQIFRARVRVVGDRMTPLDTRQIFFLVPPRIRDPGVPG